MLLGKDATETGFKKQPLDQFRILHLAVHGFADTQYPERSALVLGADPQSGETVAASAGDHKTAIECRTDDPFCL